MNKNKLMNLPNKRDYHYKSDEGEKNSQLNKYIMIACIIIVIALAYFFAQLNALHTDLVKEINLLLNIRMEDISR